MHDFKDICMHDFGFLTACAGKGDGGAVKGGASASGVEVKKSMPSPQKGAPPLPPLPPPLPNTAPGKEMVSSACIVT